jgi:2-oxoisovalerate dehydrogenase E1 component beta subunit
MTPTAATATGPTTTLIQALNQTMHLEMERNPNVVVLGEDVGINGGVFRATDGLFKTYGEARVIDTPLSEAAIVGAAFGMAVAGLRPIAEIQFSDYTFPAFDQITSEVAKLRYRSGGDVTCPLVIRTPYGGGIRGGHYHSQSPEAYYTQTPGLTVVIPSTPYDAKGLLASAIRGDDPVVFLEPKRLYRTVKAVLPTEEYTVPIGPLRVAQAGTDLTVIAYGAMIPLCEQAAKLVSQQTGASIELLDLRTLYPMDEAGIIASVRKTGRAVMVYEAPKTGGYGAEVAALLAEKAIDSLKAPVLRVAGFDTPYPYSLESIYYPTVARIAAGLTQTLNYQ